MDELPTNPEAQSAAILTLEARVHAMHSMIALLVADNAAVIERLKEYAGIVEDIGLATPLTDQQISTMHREIEGVLHTVAAIHQRLGIDPSAPPAQ
ncbi:hypothetical protein HK414_13055 [Ramlibacter terrae]|uniref:Uncharacterized protein n=1 Tax=Ramlibacter terrae TaxID=2732511 RepID=A0ABX6P2N7_9BURK|nr:hypothetical protein HK414_13055 [Ramlibacter terrae]